MTAVHAPPPQNLRRAFALALLVRLLYPFFDSPLSHLFSDPQRHWDNGERFLHPGIMGSTDPFLYQLWVWLLRWAAHGETAWIALGCGILCAAMPYGWYRTFRELMPARPALTGALLIALIPESLGIYAYFMNETLLITLLGFCFWLALRARRKHSGAAFAAAAAAWLCAALTRTVAAPMAAGIIVWLILASPRRPRDALLAALLALAIAVPAGLHGRAKLGFFAPFGNLYFNEVYSVSGKHDIEVDYGPEGRYHFGCPSFYNPTFFPFSAWTTARVGVAAIRVDLSKGRHGWIAEKARIAAHSDFPAWRARWENALYLLFGQDWPNSDRTHLWGWLTLWTRWAWAPVILAVTYGAARRRFSGTAWLLPLAGLGTIALLLAQSEGVMEARFREPIDAILVASLWIMAQRRRSNSHTPAPARGLTA